MAASSYKTGAWKEKATLFKQDIPLNISLFSILLSVCNTCKML